MTHLRYHHFQFPLWDTKPKKNQKTKKEKNFQFPLWDTYNKLKRDGAITEEDFQFPLWDT